MENKKTLILSIIGVLILVIAVAGVSFAMYTFTGTGTTQNVIQTGTITMNFDPSSTITLEKEYPMTDAKGIQKDPTEFGVQATWGSTKMTINYDIGVTIEEKGQHLTEDYIKIALLDANDQVIVGEKNDEAEGALKAGVKLSTLANTPGKNNIIKNYGLTGGSLTTSGDNDKYKLIAYISDDYNLDEGLEETDTTEGNHTITKETTSETFKFKITVQASQQ